MPRGPERDHGSFCLRCIAKLCLDTSSLELNRVIPKAFELTRVAHFNMDEESACRANVARMSLRPP